MFEPEVFRKQMYCLEKSRLHVTVLGLIGAPAVIRHPILIRRPDNYAPLVTPLGAKTDIGPPSLGPCRNLYSLFV